MKKLALSQVFPFREKLQKILRIMKITWLLTLITTLQVSASVYSQNTTFSIRFKDASLYDLMLEINNNSEFDFVYSDDEVENVKINDGGFSGSNVENILTHCLKGTKIAYKIEDKVIVLMPASPKPVQQKEENKITGKVTNDEGIPLPGVSVLLKGSYIGTSTDSNGRFVFKISGGIENKVLVFSFIGMKAKEVKVAGQKDWNIVLSKEDSELDEVVITGMFVKKEASYTGSAVTINAEELQQFGNRNILTSLRNIEPSLNIITNNSFGSNPNRLPEIQIRGNSSIPNIDQLQDEAREQARIDMNTPLVILDGFESTLQNMVDMNENEIESITILKDAAATAIYGSRAANGVIVVITKAPKPGKLRISYRGDLNVEIPDLTSYNLLDAREKLELELVGGLFDDTYSEEKRIRKRKYYNYLLGEINRGVNTDWLSKPLQVGIGQRHNIKLQGGDKQFTYSASAQYNNTVGVMKESSRDVFNGTIKLLYRLKDVKFTNNLIITHSNSNNSPYGDFSTYAKLNPYLNPYDENGEILQFMGTEWNAARNKVPNPLYDATLNTFNKTNETTLKNHFRIEWQIAKGLSLKSNIGITKTFKETNTFYPAKHSKFRSYKDYKLLTKGEYQLGNTNKFIYDGSLNLSYSRKFAKKHLLFAGVDCNIRESVSDSYKVIAEGFPNEDLAMLYAALQYKEGSIPSGSEYVKRTIGLTGNFNYTYDGKYFADLSLRSDGSSSFGANKRFATFWATGIGWNVHNEDFMKGVSFLNRLKIRFSTGVTGSQQFSAYQALATMKYYTADKYYNWIGAHLMGLGNENLKWQQKFNNNLGIDFSLFKNRINGSLDIYKETTKDLVSSIEVPRTHGFRSYINNIGEVENKGFEAKLTGIIIRDTKNKIMWSVTGSMIHNQNEIVKISDALKKAQAESQAELTKSALVNPNVQFKEGYSQSTIWAVKSLGIDPATGKEIYLSKSGEPTTKWNAADITDCGDSQPKFQGSLNSSLRLKNWLLTVSMGYRFGGQQYNSTLIEKVENANYLYNTDARVLEERWRNVGDKSEFKSIYITDATYKTSRFVQDENTLKLQNVTLSYNLRSKNFVKQFGIENLRLSASMSDLFYLSSIKRERGISYPFSRQLSFNISVTF